MSIKAMNWAMDQATGDPRAQCLLYVIADVANEEGIAWPGADWMAEKSQQSRATVYRRLDALQASGLLVMFPRWIDDQGKIWSAAAPGRRRTSPEIRLQFGVLIKQSTPPDEAETDTETAEPSSQPETGVSHRSDSPISPQRQGLSHCGDNNHHPTQEKDSPPPPSGGSGGTDDWKEFEKDWTEPILRQSLAQQVWAALTPTERIQARQAARGYVNWRKSQKRPPNVIGAHLFLKERAAWEKFASFAASSPPSPDGYPKDSAEGKAIAALFTIAGCFDFFVNYVRKNDVVYYRHPVTPQLLKLSEVGPREQWIAATREQAAAWNQFLEKYPTIEHRKRIVEGDLVPANGKGWRPNVDGTWSTSDTLMNEEDYATLS